MAKNTLQDVSLGSTKFYGSTSLNGGNSGIGLAPRDTSQDAMVGDIPIVYRGSNQSIKNKKEQQSALNAYNAARKQSIADNTSVTLDKNTGKITIKAPGIVIDSKGFKAKYGDGSILNQLSQQYKSNPNVKVTTNDGKQMTIPELVTEWEKGTKSLAGNLADLLTTKEWLASVYDKRAMDFDEDQTRIAAYSAINYGNTKASDTDRQYIPKWLLNTEKGKKIANLGSWDEASGTVERKDLLTWWNLGKFSRDEMNYLKGMADVNIKYGAWSDEDTYEADEVDENGDVLYTTNEDNLTSKTEVAKTISFLRFITAQDPEGNIFEKTGNVVESTEVNFLMNFSEAFTGTAAAIETGFAFLTDNLDTWRMFTDKDQAMKDATAYYNEAMSIASDSAVAVGQIAGVGGQIAGHIALAKSAGIVAGWAGEGVGAAKAAISTTNVGAKLTQAAYGASAGIAEMAKTAEAIAAGSKALTTALATTGKIGKVFSQAVSVARAVAQTPLAKTAIGFLSDTIVDAAISNPQAMRTLLADVRKGNVSAEDLAYAQEQFVQNLQGWAVFRGAGVAIKGALTKTTLGKAVNLKVSQFLTKIDNFNYDIDNAVKAKILKRTVVEDLEDKLKNLAEKKLTNTAQYRRLQNKLTIAQNNKILRDFKETFASGKNWDDVLARMEKSGMIKMDAEMKGLKKWVNEASIIQNNIRAWNNAIDNMQRGVMREAISLLDKKQNPFTAETNDALTDWTSKLAKMESKKKGLTYDDKHVSMSKESSNYMGYKQTRERANIMANDEKLSDAVRTRARRYVDFADEQMEELSDVLGVDITKKLDEGLALYVNEYEALNDFASSKGYINAVEQAEFDDMELWETGYVRTQRIMDDAGIVINTKSGKKQTKSAIDTEHYTFGKKDFKDFEQTRAEYRNRIAEVAYQKKLLDTYMLNGVATTKTFISAEETEKVRKLGEAKLNYQRQVSELTMNAKGTFTVKEGKASRNMSQADFQKTIYGLGYEDSQTIIDNYSDLNEYDRKTFVDGYTGPAIDNLDDAQKVEYWDRFTEPLNEEAIHYLGSRGITTIDDLNKVYSEEGTDFLGKLNQAYLMGDNSLRSSEVIKKISKDRYTNRADMVKDLKVARTKSALSEFDAKLGKGAGSAVTDGMVDYSDSWIDDVVAKSDEQWAAKKTSEARASMLGTEEDITREYTVLESIQKNSDYRADAYSQIDAELKTRYGNDVTDNEMDKLKQEAHNVFDATLESRINTAKASLLESTTDEALRRNVYDEISDLDKKIRGADEEIKRSVNKGESTNIILSTDEMGRKVYYEVDPVIASIYNNKQQLTAREASGLAKANYAMSKMFRLGTTTANLTSFGNQFFKDTGDAIFVGGMWDTLKNNADAFRDVFGDEVIEQLKAYDPYELKSIAKIASDEGLSDVEALQKYEMGRASRIANESSEVEMYKRFRETIYGGDQPMNALKKMDNAAQQAIEWFDDKANGIRERYLRKNTYMSNLNEWLKNGYSISQARTAAEFAARNATTNFGRSLYHLQNISESTPYFAAAINGTKSFWRMFELDPVGITGRFMGGLVLPVMYLTAQSLSNEEDAAVYKNLPEYARSGNLTFVTNGQVFNIPLPEQLADLVNPFRHFVEYTYDANKSTFWKLAANDLLGLSPIDLQGFSSVDFNDMTNDPTFLDMAGRGFSRLFSQAAPVPFKTAYMGMTGIDPYTGKKIVGTTRYYYDEETESVQMMDYTQNMFARTVASWFGSDNPAIIEKMTSGIFGGTGTDVLGAIFGLFAAVNGKDPYSGGDYSGAQWAEGVASQALDRLTAPVTGPNYDQVNSMWNQAIRQLSEKKEAIKNSKEVQAINQKLATEKDPEARKKLIAQRQSYKDEFDQNVKNTVENLCNKYNGTFDRHKLASVMALLNFSDDSGWATATALSQNLHSDLFYEGREQAIQSMVDMGVTGTNDTSVFGYYTKNVDGEVVLKYNSPLAILNAQNIWYGRNEIDQAAIKNTLEANVPNLSQERSDMWARVKAAKGNTAKDAVREEWNEKILGAIMPYIADLPTDQVLNNDAVVNYLEGYIQVPSWYEKVKNRYVSSGYDAETGTYKLDKNKAFIESYLRTVLEKR